MEKNILSENMRRFKTKNLNEEQLDEAFFTPVNWQPLIDAIAYMGLPAWTALPVAVGMYATPVLAIELVNTVKHKIKRLKLTPEEAEKFAIEVETAIKDIPGRKRAYLTQLLNSYKQALAAEAGGLDNITNITGDDAKDLMLKYMDALKRKLPELSKEK
jgi:hypothetical protein